MAVNKKKTTLFYPLISLHLAPLIIGNTIINITISIINDFKRLPRGNNISLWIFVVHVRLAHQINNTMHHMCIHFFNCLEYIKLKLTLTQ